MKQYIASFLFGASLLGLAGSLTSCNDYLDKYPDSRMDLKTPDQLSLLLTSAYPSTYPAYLFEMYSDNADEHISPSWSEADRFQREAYHWDDITEVGGGDTPQMLWNQHYLSVNIANEVLSFIDKQSDKQRFSAQEGEAKLCRAYAMFTLANIFCVAYNPKTADAQLGLPYPSEPQDRPGTKFSRGTLAELYARIERDLTEGLALVGSTYTAPKFHFTPEAAHAFAARFFLYKQDWNKAVEHANVVLGANPAAGLRNWVLFNRQGLNGEAMPNEYVRSSAKTNLLLQVVASPWPIYAGPFGFGGRYSHGSEISEKETLESNGPWGAGETALNFSTGTNAGQPQVLFNKLPRSFKYSDRQAGIGMYYTEYAVFTADETLLTRAEAYARLGQYDRATADLNTELSVFMRKPKTFTTAELATFYKKIKYYTPDSATVRKRFHLSEPLDTATQEPLLQCILHLRRIQTMHEGLRLPDVKRYGITLYRRRFDTSGKLLAVPDTMKADDPRFAVQIPQDVISAGIEPNPRNVSSSK